MDNPWQTLARRVRAMHVLWTELTADLSPAQVNHHERPGVLPIAFSLFHYVNGEDRSCAQRLLNQPEIWSVEWSGRTGVAFDAVKRGTPIAVAEQVRVTDMDAWRAYQADVFARTESALAVMPAERWAEVVYESVPEMLQGGFIAHLANGGPIYLGDLMDGYLYQHGMRHLGEIEHARSLVGLQGLG